MILKMGITFKITIIRDYREVWLHSAIINNETHINGVLYVYPIYILHYISL